MRVCVTGGSGFVGSNIVHTAATTRTAHVLATSRTWQGENDILSKVQMVRADMNDTRQFAKTIEEFEPTVIVHCAIDNTNFAAMERDHRIAWHAFVDPVVSLADIANRSSARLVQISTDWVFDGSTALAAEDAPAAPVNLVGRMKIAAEQTALSNANRGSVARISGVNGPHRMRSDIMAAQNQGFGNFVTAVVETLRRGDDFEVWTGNVTDVANPSHASDCAEMILRIAERDLDGVFHCCGSEAVSRVDLARMVAEAMGAPADRITERADLPTHARHHPVPRTSSLDNSATRAALQFQPMTLPQLIDAVISDHLQGTP